MSAFVPATQVDDIDDEEPEAVPEPDLPDIVDPEFGDIDDIVRVAPVCRAGDADRMVWHVGITDGMREWAREEARGERDTQDARDQETSDDHMYQGLVGETVAAAVCEHEGAEWSMHDGYEADLDINALMVDVKARVVNERGHKDLLVGMRVEGNESDLTADAFVQVVVDEDCEAAMLTGWALHADVADAPRFARAQTWPSKIVWHDDLRDAADLIVQ